MSVKRYVPRRVETMRRPRMPGDARIHYPNDHDDARFYRLR
jgi:hypothetical protein